MTPLLSGRSKSALLETFLERTPEIPLPPESASLDTYGTFALELAQRDPEAFECYRTAFELGRRIREGFEK